MDHNTMFTELHPRRRPGAPASQDTVRQLAVIRSLLRSISPTAAAEAPSAATVEPAGRHALFTLEAMAARKTWARALSSEARAMVISHLNRAEVLGTMRTFARAPPDAAIAGIAGDFPHAAPVLDWLKEHMALARCCPGQELSFPPVLLNGPAGTGKTALSMRLAAAIGTHHRTIDMSTLHASFSVVGLDAGYSTARPGLIWDALQNACMSPVILLDELDKSPRDAREDPAAFLYQLLEPSSAHRFEDAALGLAVDASKILWIATCNDTSRIDPPILSRFMAFDVPLPDAHQMPAVVRSIQRELLNTAPWANAFEGEIPDEVLNLFAGIAPRLVHQVLRGAYARAAQAGRRQLCANDIRVPPKASRTRPIGFLHA